MVQKVAFITGGASGMGLAVAQALSTRTDEEWELHVVDLNDDAGKKATTKLKNAHFHQANVTDYNSLVAAFEATWSISGRLDFVYANAGIVERYNFYEEHPLDSPPPPPNQLSVDINLKSVIDTSWLTLHYFRRSLAKHGKEGHDAVLIMTASCGGLYPSEFCPCYSASKAGVIHFNRAITTAYHHAGIRTFVTCPGTIRTGLLSGEEWKSFPEEYFTPMETLVDTVVKLVDGGAIEDAKGRRVEKEQNWGLAVEVHGRNFYFRDQADFCDESMREMMKASSMEVQLARIEKTKSENAAA